MAKQEGQKRVRRRERRDECEQGVDGRGRCNAGSGRQRGGGPARLLEEEAGLVHFGLGDATDAGTAEIHWPSGQVETIKLPAVDRIYTIEENKGITAALCAGQPCVDPTAPAK